MDNFNKSANQLWKESNTTLSFKGPSDKVNIEFDLLVKKSS